MEKTVKRMIFNAPERLRDRSLLQSLGLQQTPEKITLIATYFSRPNSLRKVTRFQTFASRREAKVWLRQILRGKTND